MKILNQFLTGILALVMLASCGEDEGEGTLSIELWGEEFIEETIPKEEFVDGWSVTYSKFLISVGDVAAEDVFSFTSFKVWDLTQKGPFTVFVDTVEEGELEHANYTIKPSTDSTSGNVSTEDLSLMHENGYSVYVEGSAVLGDSVKQFSWGFTSETSYNPCRIETTVKKDDETRIELTIHGDHFFYDSAVGEEPSLRFVEIASADANEDNVITKEELEQFNLAPLDHHDVGNLDIENMWQYLSYMVTTLGHINGEGHCENK